MTQESPWSQSSALLRQRRKKKLVQNANKSFASTAPCPAIAFTSINCPNAVKNKMCSTCYVPLHFCKASRKYLKPFSRYRKVTYMTCFKGRKLQKVGKSELRFLCFANCITVTYICIKFQENISNSFQVTEWTQIYYRNHYFQSSEGHNLKRRLTRLPFLCCIPRLMRMRRLTWVFAGCT